MCNVQSKYMQAKTQIITDGALSSFSRYSESSVLSLRPTVDVAAGNLRGWNIWYKQARNLSISLAYLKFSPMS